MLELETEKLGSKSEIRGIHNQLTSFEASIVINEDKT